ncbi:hypothetical protein HZA26_03135 [Candidatus Nomurabacteria bacterium]|nr:hypothetical protein [Candidatus Nomurabacteria bacterium]
MKLFLSLFQTLNLVILIGIINPSWELCGEVSADDTTQDLIQSRQSLDQEVEKVEVKLKKLTHELDKVNKSYFKAKAALFLQASQEANKTYFSFGDKFSDFKKKQDLLKQRGEELSRQREKLLKLPSESADNEQTIKSMEEWLKNVELYKQSWSNLEFDASQNLEGIKNAINLRQEVDRFISNPENQWSEKEKTLFTWLELLKEVKLSSDCTISNFMEQAKNLQREWAKEQGKLESLMDALRFSGVALIGQGRKGSVVEENDIYLVGREFFSVVQNDPNKASSVVKVNLDDIEILNAPVEVTRISSSLRNLPLNLPLNLKYSLVPPLQAEIANGVISSFTDYEKTKIVFSRELLNRKKKVLEQKKKEAIQKAELEKSVEQKEQILVQKEKKKIFEKHSTQTPTRVNGALHDLLKEAMEAFKQKGPQGSSGKMDPTGFGSARKTVSG